MSGQTDYGALFKDAFNAFIKGENLVPLIVGSLAVTVGAFTIILLPPLMLGLTATAIKVARGEPVKIDDLWVGFKKFGASLALGIIFAVLSALGFALLVVPGLIVMFVFTFALHALADDPDVGAGGAIKESYRLVKANVVDVLIIWLASAVLTSVLSWTGVGAIAAEAFIALLSAMLYVKVAGAAAAARAAA